MFDCEETAAPPPISAPKLAPTLAPTLDDELRSQNILKKPISFAPHAEPSAAFPPVTADQSPNTGFIADCTEAGMFMIVSRAAANTGHPEFAAAMMQIAGEKADSAAKSVEALIKKYMQ
jgi:hypothetical protein